LITTRLAVAVGSSRRTGGAAEHVIDGGTGKTHFSVEVQLNFILLKGAVKQLYNTDVGVTATAPVASIP